MLPSPAQIPLNRRFFNMSSFPSPSHGVTEGGYLVPSTDSTSSFSLSFRGENPSSPGDLETRGHLSGCQYCAALDRERGWIRSTRVPESSRSMGGVRSGQAARGRPGFEVAPTLRNAFFFLLFFFFFLMLARPQHGWRTDNHEHW